MTVYITELSPADYPWQFAIDFDYSEVMVQELKRDIPPRLRKWDRERRQWLLRDATLARGRTVMDCVCELATLICGGYAYVKEVPPPPVAPGLTSAFQTLHLLPDAPPALVHAAYRVLAKEAHPDQGGDVRRMQALNAAYSLLCASQK